MTRLSEQRDVQDALINYLMKGKVRVAQRGFWTRIHG